MMHGAMVDEAGKESVSDVQIKSFNTKSGKNLATVYFTDKWAESKIKAPLDKIDIVIANGAVPIIRLQNSDDPDGGSGKAGKYSHQNIIDGKWDKELKQYAVDLGNRNVLIEYGTEINGDWFDWSLEGPEKFKKAFRYISKILNRKLVFHVDATDNNKSPKWYPGDDVCCLVGTSCYGGYGSGRGCVTTLAKIYKDFASISETIPLAILEWGAPEAKNIKFNVQDTIDTLRDMPQYDRIVLLQRWAEKIIPGHSEDEIGDGRIDVTPEMLKAYREGIANPVYTSK